jgi:hypothetical protein
MKTRTRNLLDVGLGMTAFMGVFLSGDYLFWKRFLGTKEAWATVFAHSVLAGLAFALRVRIGSRHQSLT